MSSRPHPCHNLARRLSCLPPQHATLTSFVLIVLRSDGRRTSPSESHQAFCTLGGGKCVQANPPNRALSFKPNNLNFLSPPSVFWDLYCAAPERRDTCEHSSEAKAFHDYVCRSHFVVVCLFACCHSLCVVVVVGAPVFPSLRPPLCGLISISPNIRREG